MGRTCFTEALLLNHEYSARSFGINLETVSGGGGAPSRVAEAMPPFSLRAPVRGVLRFSSSAPGNAPSGDPARWV